MRTDVDILFIVENARARVCHSVTSLFNSIFPLQRAILFLSASQLKDKTIRDTQRHKEQFSLCFHSPIFKGAYRRGEDSTHSRLSPEKGTTTHTNNRCNQDNVFDDLQHHQFVIMN